MAAPTTEAAHPNHKDTLSLAPDRRENTGAGAGDKRFEAADHSHADNNGLLAQALQYQQAGFGVIIVGDDKKPRGRWRDAMRRMLSRDELALSIRRGGTGLAVVGGAVSGGLLVIDLDPDKLRRAVTPLDLEHDFHAPLRAAIAAVIDPDTLPCQRTVSGGYQYYLHCPDAPGNLKLAGVPAWKVLGEQVLVGTPGAPHTALETRGEGGYAVIPTEGSGREWVNLSLLKTPTVMQEQLETILAAGRNLDRVPAPTPAPPRPKRAQYRGSYTGDSPIAAYNATHTVEELLEAHDYEYDERERRWRCPGSTSGNAGVGVKNSRVLSYHTSDPLHMQGPDGKLLAHDAFGAYTILKHGGDRDAALEAWLEEWRPQRRPATPAPAAPTQLETPAADRAELGGDEGAVPADPVAETAAPEPISGGAAIEAKLRGSVPPPTAPEPVAPDLGNAALRQGLELAARYGCTTEVCTDRYLDIERLKSDVLLLRAAMGTGKTDAVARLLTLLGDDLSVLAVSHLVGLVAKLAGDFGVEDYRAIPHGYERSRARAGYCINSLWRLLIGGGPVPVVDILVADEIEQLLRRLTSRDKFAHKRACLGVLKTLVRKARYVILADAHMSDTTLRWIRRLRPDSTPHMLLGTHRPGVGRVMYKYANRGDVRAVARDRLRAGRRVYYALNGLERAQEVEGWITDLTGELHDLRVLLICSTTMSKERVKRWFADPTRESRNYDLIVASPSVATGVSIEAGVVDVVCGEFGAQVATPYDAVQMLARPREVPELHVWVDDRRNAKCTDRKAILGAFWRQPGEDGNMVDDSDDESGLGGVDRHYGELYLDVMVDTAHAVNDYAGLFWRLVDDDGYEVRSGDAAPDAKTIEQHGREVAKRRDIERHLEALDLTDEEDAALAAKDELTPEQHYARKRHRLKRTYRLPEEPTDEELLAVYFADGDGDLRRQLERLELAAAAPEAVDRLMEQQTRYGTLKPDVVRYDHHYDAYRHTAEFVGLNPVTWESTSKRYDAEALREHWVRPLEAIWHVYRVSVPYWPTLEYALEDPVKALSNVLRGAFGLGQRQQGRNQAERTYALSDGPLERRRYWLLRRARLPEGQGAPYHRDDWTESEARQVDAYFAVPAKTRQQNTHIDDSAVVAPVSSPPCLPPTVRPEAAVGAELERGEAQGNRLDGYQRLRDVLTSGYLRGSPPAPKLLECYRLADEGDETARQHITRYLADSAVQRQLHEAVQPGHIPSAAPSAQGGAA